MISHFAKLEWKQYFRSSYWQKSLALNILLLFFALYFLATFLLLGFGIVPLLKKLFPDDDPLLKINSFLIFWFLGDLVFRYLMQKIPMMNIRPLLFLPIKKTKLIHYVLGKSVVSFFNIMPLFFFIPTSIMLLREGYGTSSILAWLIAMTFLTLANNFVNFLINRSNIAFISIASLLAVLIGLQYFGVYDVASFFGALFNLIIYNPTLSLVPIALTLLAYFFNFKNLKGQIYLDGAVSKKVKEASTANLSWADHFGDIAPFIKNDIRLIWRNKRPRTVFFISIIFILYGLIFFGNDNYKGMPAFLVFVCVFITGGFALNFGQFIPAWDSSYYAMLMSQNIRYRRFLESKWYLMVIVTAASFLLSIPYIYFGINIFLLIASGAIFNIGFTSLFLLYAGSFNRKRIDLEKSGFANYQGTSATQFLIIIPIMGVPMLIFFVFSKLFDFNVGVAALAIVGIVCLLFRNYLLNYIEKRYLETKYETISAFEQKA